MSYNRREALGRTLRELSAQGVLDRGEVIVVDNGSTDGTVTMVRAEFPRARVEESATNSGVSAFNRGVVAARGDRLLILDDDAWPDAKGLTEAEAAMDGDAGLGAVALGPVHPASGTREWPFARAVSDDFPLMGCGNLVRADAWRAVGGYDGSFFLYRNDVDLALKLREAGYRVAYHPEWVVWHDSPGANRKSERWLRLATRNWVWLCRRHGVGVYAWWVASLGAGRAALHAGIGPARIWAVVRGVWAGVTARPGAAPASCRRDTDGLRRLMAVRRGR